MAKRAEVEQLWRRFHDRLRSFIERRVDSREDAEDIVQDAFIRIQGNLDRLKDTDSVQARAYRITGNAITDDFRTKQRGLRAIDTSGRTEIQYETAPLPPITAFFTSPLEKSIFSASIEYLSRLKASQFK